MDPDKNEQKYFFGIDTCVKIQFVFKYDYNTNFT